MASFGVLGSTIKVFTGPYYDVDSPHSDCVDIRDIARGLSHICRFGGQIPRYYSVAEHSLECYRKAQAELQPYAVLLACLLHDAAEAYIGDIVKPLKNIIAPIYKPIENRNEAAIAEAFGVDFESTKPIWKRIDMELLIAERNAIFGDDGVKWTGEGEVASYTFTPQFYSPDEAYAQFLAAFHGVQAAKGGEQCQRS